MRDAGSRVLLEIFRNLQLLPDPHPALRATFPGGEGFGTPQSVRASSKLFIRHQSRS